MKKIFIFIIFVFIVFYLSAQEWTNISPFPASNRGILGNFISEEEGWVLQIGMYISRDIYHTEDGGQNWEIIYSLEDSLEFFISLQMIDNQHGWATKKWRNNQYPYNSYTSYINTTDSGYSWEDMTEYVPDVNEAYPFYFINQDIGFFCGGCDSLSLAALIYKTIDGGYNWYLTETPTVYDPYPYLAMYCVNKFFFLDENNGWAACTVLFDAGLSLFTSDGGENWEVGIEPGPPDVFDIHFINPDYGGAVGRNAFYSFVFITENNFQTILYFYEAWDLEMGQMAQAISFQNDSTIWVTGEPGIIYRSTDGGASFEAFQVIDAWLHTIQFFGNTGYIFGYNQNALLKFVDPVVIDNDMHIQTQDLNIIAYPNPFNPVTTISFELNTDNTEGTELVIYNIEGQKIKQYLIFPEQSQAPYGAGNNQSSITWDGKNNKGKEVSSGVYLYRLRLGDQVITRKMLLLR